ncbi:MAG TPA: ATP-dependent RecD-like DNA helicase [Chloroflexota bacterium]|nr:ATP-dependent RecD-like DNA helicase [Chloroflexota bacterium]
MAATLVGSVERITYVNPDNGYTVARVQEERESYLVTVVGNLPSVNVGESLRLSGRWTTHRVHGRQFEAEACEVVLPATVQGIRKYLGSGLIKGIGPVTAERIVERFGADTLDIIEEAPNRLVEVNGLGPKRAALITRAWDEQKAIKHVMLFLQSHDVSTALAVRIYKKYGDASVDVVRKDPYRLARDVHGIGFITADKIATKLGFAPDSVERLMAGLLHLLWEATDEGHVFLPSPKLLEGAAELLGCETTSLDEALERLSREENGVRLDEIDGETAVYLIPYYQAEIHLAQRLFALLRNPRDRMRQFQTVDFAAAFGYLRQRNNLELSEKQAEAVQQALTSKVTVLTGGPGTGKTTTIRSIIALAQAKRLKVVLAAPTGRAAKRLSEVTGTAARTLHRLLEVRPGTRAGHDADNPIDADLIVVDEMSMVDLLLANTFVKAVPPDAHVVLVGDVDQLPSVGAGNVLRDLIDSGVVPTTRLDTIFRQAETSAIVSNAHLINAGKTPRVGGGSKDFFFLTEEDPEKAADTIIDLVSRRLPGRYGLQALRDIQVLSPMHGGTVGVGQLNARLQEALNPAGPGKPERRYGNRLFREGDKVMQIRNDYDKNVFNGDIGWIVQVDLPAQLARVRFEDGRLVDYDFGELDELIHAFAVSVHKSQGGEYPVVVMPVMAQHYVMLQRNLLYTGITRARRLVVLVGTWRALSIAVRNNKVIRRHSYLAERLILLDCRASSHPGTSLGVSSARG